MPRKKQQPVLQIVVEGSGLGPENIPVRQLAELLNATAATLDALASEQDVAPVQPSLVAIKPGSTKYELTCDAPTWEPLVGGFYEAARTRGERMGEKVRAGLARIHSAGAKLGAVRIHAKHLHDSKKRPPILLAQPMHEVPTSTAMSRTVYGRVVGVFESERGRRAVRLALVDGGREEFECAEDLAERAGRLFARNARVRATGVLDGDRESSWQLRDLQPWSDTDLIDALLEVRRELEADGVSIDVDRWLQEQD